MRTQTVLLLVLFCSMAYGHIDYKHTHNKIYDSKSVLELVKSPVDFSGSSTVDFGKLEKKSGIWPFNTDVEINMKLEITDALKPMIRLEEGVFKIDGSLGKAVVSYDWKAVLGLWDYKGEGGQCDFEGGGFLFEVPSLNMEQAKLTFKDAVPKFVNCNDGIFGDDAGFPSVVTFRDEINTGDGLTERFRSIFTAQMMGYAQETFRKKYPASGNVHIGDNFATIQVHHQGDHERFNDDADFISAHDFVMKHHGASVEVVPSKKGESKIPEFNSEPSNVYVDHAYYKGLMQALFEGHSSWESVVTEGEEPEGLPFKLTTKHFAKSIDGLMDYKEDTPVAIICKNGEGAASFSTYQEASHVTYPIKCGFHVREHGQESDEKILDATFTFVMTGVYKWLDNHKKYGLERPSITVNDFKVQAIDTRRVIPQALLDQLQTYLNLANVPHYIDDEFMNVDSITTTRQDEDKFVYRAGAT